MPRIFQHCPGTGYRQYVQYHRIQEGNLGGDLKTT